VLLQGKLQQALKSFAEDVYHCSCQYGPRDWHTSLGYYNLSKVLAETHNTSGALSCSGLVVEIWLEALLQLVLGMTPGAAAAAIAAAAAAGGAGGDGGAGAGDQQQQLGAAVTEALGRGGGSGSSEGVKAGEVGRLQMTEVADMLQVG
jgi:hypothetical protein